MHIVINIVDFEPLIVVLFSIYYGYKTLYLHIFF
jgi:hypothetical protein